MAKFGKEEIIRRAEEEDVEFIRLQFTDMQGRLKNIAVTARELPRALDNECIIDGAYIAGVAGEEETDMYLHPDAATFAILPWRPQQGKVARLLCDIYRPDRTPYPISPRYLLKKMEEKARAEGYSFYIDPECEFFLFNTDEDGNPTTKTNERAGYLDVSPVDLGENARRDMVLTLEEMGVDVVSSHHETAPGQQEIDFQYAEPLEMADQIMTFRMAVRTIAKRHGLHATFMPKPRADLNGSGMHLNFSVFRGGKNLFSDPEEKNGLSREAYWFIGGLLKHGREMAAVTSPLVNSYKRLTPGYEAPTEVCWSNKYQNPLVRVPIGRGENTRIELRSPDAASDPYLVLALAMAAGLEGIREQTDPAARFEEADKAALPQLPENLSEALKIFEESPWIREQLGDTFVKQYAAAKKKEWRSYLMQVTKWELEEYLHWI